MSRNAFVQAFRLQNFMGFEDTGWIEFRPITLLFGRNSTGKSSLMRALLLLRQSVLFPDDEQPFSYVIADELDLGGFSVLVRNHCITDPIVVWFRCSIPQTPPAETNMGVSPSENTRAGDLLGRWLEGVSFLSETAFYVDVKLRLEYRFRETDKHTVLSAVDLIDTYGDILFQAIAPEVSTPDSPWFFDSQFFDPNPPSDSTGMIQGELMNVWKSAVVFVRDGFLPKLRVLDEAIGNGDDESRFGEDYDIIFQVLERLRLEISTFLKNIIHLGPIRAAPQRFYYLAAPKGKQTSTGSESIRQFHLTRRVDLDKYNRIRKWMLDSPLRVQPELLPVNEDKGIYELVFIEPPSDVTSKSLAVNVSEVGSGLSQVLPIIVDALLSSAGSVVLAEQPELHLHPRAQSELGTLFSSVAQEGVSFFIETHSEHLLLRLQTQIAKTTSGEFSSQDRAKMLLPKQVAVYFVDRKDQLSTVSHIEIGPYGDLLSTPEGFDDFFSDDLTETAERMRARLSSLRRNQ